MKQSKVYKLLVVFCLLAQSLFSQIEVSGTVVDKNTQQPIEGVEVYSKALTKTVYTNSQGRYQIILDGPSQELVFINFGYQILEIEITPSEKKRAGCFLRSFIPKIKRSGNYPTTKRSFWN